MKQCRTNVADKSLLDICIALIQPALGRDDDEEIQLLAIESIGLLSLLDRDLFCNYSTVFKAIIEENIQRIYQEQGFRRNQLNETIIAIKSTFDGLIIHGIQEDSNDQLDIIL